ncbi:MAG TPA: LLM class F420-dependent oxidoreductase [Alphaproteobacteria bacterium]|jgi:probable F420-dependent oxidoreductase|nr:LLM class F420-dependent oxidoreductase [Alphaproteobacteria bacterium]
MQYGFSIPNGGPLAGPEALRKIALKGEELGFDCLVAPDHIIIPKSIDSAYPYSESGEFVSLSATSGECLEMHGVLSFLAAVTSRMRLITSVMVVPYRHPVLAAKLLATIDVLSAGRLTVGCGAGWMEEEFAPLGAPPFAERGKATDEFIAAFKELWSSDTPTFEGAYTRFANIAFAPKPVQRPHPPIWIGGESGPAMKRTVRLADGWYPIGNNPRFPMNTVGRFADGVQKLRGFAEEAGRDPAEIDLAFFAPRYNESEAQILDDGARQAFTGSAEEIAADIAGFRDSGLRHLVLNFLDPSLERTLERMAFFAETVRPLAGD